MRREIHDANQVVTERRADDLRKLPKTFYQLLPLRSVLRRDPRLCPRTDGRVGVTLHEEVQSLSGDRWDCLRRQTGRGRHQEADQEQSRKQHESPLSSRIALGTSATLTAHPPC